MSKKVTIQARMCYDCSCAYLMRSAPRNPVVVECAITHEREVARTTIRCRNFKQRLGEAVIHPMIHCKQL